MPDTVDPTTRTRIMASVRSKNTSPEMTIRRLLHRRGFRFRIHVADLPGKPDIVLPKYRAIVLVNGCFWHGHNCPLFRLPKSRVLWWNQKIQRTQERDRAQLYELQAAGWRVCLVWECALKRAHKIDVGELGDRLESWIRSDIGFYEIEGVVDP